MALYTGVTGKISVKKGSSSAKDVAYIANWTVDLSKEIIEVPSFGKTYKEKLPGLKDWTASADGSADFAESSGQKDLLDAFEDGAKIEASFYLDENTFFVGDAYIESLSITHASEGKADIDISLSGSDAVELTVNGTVNGGE